jgi:hypothetical protein
MHQSCTQCALFLYTIRRLVKPRARQIHRDFARFALGGTTDFVNSTDLSASLRRNAMLSGGQWPPPRPRQIDQSGKAIFTYAFDWEYVTSKTMLRYPKPQRVHGEPRANREVFTSLRTQNCR